MNDQDDIQMGMSKCVFISINIHEWWHNYCIVTEKRQHWNDKGHTNVSDLYGEDARGNFNILWSYFLQIMYNTISPTPE
jgi:hypothetical protein